MIRRVPSAAGLAAFWFLVSASALSADRESALTHLQIAREGVGRALELAERSLGPHQPGSGHTKLLMKEVLEMLVESGDTSVLRSLEKAEAGLRSEREGGESGQGAEVQQALAQAIADVQEAAQYAGRAIAATSVAETHAMAGLAAGLLVAARGAADRASPHTGTLTYAIRRLEQGGR